MKAKFKKEHRTPDRIPLTGIQAERLAQLTNLSAKALKGLTIAQISDKFKFQIDASLLLFKRICGKVVKKDPVTGVEYPVPFATVHVEDTDCNLIAYFPNSYNLTWFYPFFCRREEIATVTTDACGRFCVNIPIFEIDWILRWRKSRICFPDIFVKPKLKEILDDILPDPPFPDGPLKTRLDNGGLALDRIADLIGSEKLNQLTALSTDLEFGAPTQAVEKLLDSNAFSQPLPPPLPAPVKQMCEEQNFEALISHFSIDQKYMTRLAPARFIGPFKRCVDIFYPTYQTILDVPDITFRVTQDVNGDGTEEVIYSENFFDVRWNSGAIPDVTLEASPIAVAGVTCDIPEVPCEDTPAILFAGLMPTVNPAAPSDPYHDSVSGYARRPNRPHRSGRLQVQPSDLPLDLAATPYTGTLQLYGCVEVEGAAFYRILYRFENGPAVPFKGLTWPIYRVVGGNLQTQHPVSDTNGWYPVIPASQGWHPNQLLLNWPTSSFANGRYTLMLQVGNANKTIIDTASPINFQVDNTRPTVEFTELTWRTAGGTWSAPLSMICPVIHRPMIGGSPANIEFRVKYRVNATHLRHVSVSGGGCGGGTPTLISPINTAQHWHINPNDNTVIDTAQFALSGASHPGAYSFSIFASSRAFSPSGSDVGLANDWNYNPIFQYVIPRLSVAVVNG